MHSHIIEFKNNCLGVKTNLVYLLIHKGQCLCVCLCVFSIEIQTAKRIGMKFGMEVVLEGGKVLGGY